MPIILNSAYRAPVFFRNGHVATIYGGVFRKRRAPDYRREQIQLPDGDFLFLDSKVVNRQRAVILCHGIEGSSRKSYNNLAASYFLKNNYSVFAWNNRSCGGQINNGPKMYHHGDIEDLKFIVQTVLDRGFTTVFMMGFSMGGAQIINYLGRETVDSRVKGALAISTPVSLKSSADRMSNGWSKIYLRRFIGSIRQKLMGKAERYPEILKKSEMEKIKDFEDLIRYYVVPVYSYKNIDDYFLKASPDYVLSAVEVPTLILNALDDPIIGEDSFPFKEVKDHPEVFLETPKYGGHCGFPLRKMQYSFQEIRALEFFEAVSQ